MALALKILHKICQQFAIDFIFCMYALLNNSKILRVAHFPIIYTQIYMYGACAYVQICLCIGGLTSWRHSNTCLPTTRLKCMRMYVWTLTSSCHVFNTCCILLALSVQTYTLFKLVLTEYIFYVGIHIQLANHFGENRYRPTVEFWV